MEAEAQARLRRAKASAKKSREGEETLQYLIEQSTAESSEVALLLPRNIPWLVLEFPEHWQASVDAAYDVCEHESKDVRLEGYSLVVELARIGDGEEVGAMTDILAQMLQSSELDESRSEISTLKECINSLIDINATEALGLLTSLLIKETNVPADLVWRILEISAKTAFAKVMQDNTQLGAHKVVQENLYQLLEQTGETQSRLKALTLLLNLPSISGTHPSEESLTSLLSQIALCAIEEASDSSSVLAYLKHVETLLKFAASSTTPDYRWILLVYCHSPKVVYQWSKTTQAGTPGGPNMTTWLTGSWTRWKDESMKGISTPDPRLTLMDLGVKVARVAVAELPRFVPGTVSVSTVSPHISDLEVSLLLANFIYLKLRGKIPGLAEGTTSDFLQQVADTCRKGLDAAYRADDVTRSKWENVRLMCRNLLPGGKLETVHPSWAPVISVPDIPTSSQAGPLPSASKRAPAVRNPPRGPSAKAGSVIDLTSQSDRSAQSSAHKDVEMIEFEDIPPRKGSLLERMQLDNSSRRRKAEDDGRDSATATPTLASRLGLQQFSTPQSTRSDRKSHQEGESSHSNKKRRVDEEVKPERSSARNQDGHQSWSARRNQDSSKPIPTLLARMHQHDKSGDGKRAESQPLQSPLPVPPPAVNPPVRQQQPIQELVPLPPAPVIQTVIPAPLAAPVMPPSDGVIRKGRGFANAGIILQPGSVPVRSKGRGE